MIRRFIGHAHAMWDSPAGLDFEYGYRAGDRPRARSPAAGRARWPVGCRYQGAARIPPMRHVEATSTQPRSPGLMVIGTLQIVLVSSAVVWAGKDAPVTFRSAAADG